ncbi:MAG TPA: helix-turn-helix domain-containing protein [Pyrinomonadaceae bacterium]|jgi:hypothetical protein
MPKNPKSDAKTVEVLNERFIMIPLNFFRRGLYLSPQAKWLYVVLKSFENSKSKQLNPRQIIIQEVSGLSKNAITQALKELEQFGWISRTMVKGKSTKYELNQPISDKEKREGIVYPIPTKGSAESWRMIQRSIKSENGKTFAEKFEEKKQSESKYK